MGSSMMSVRGVCVEQHYRDAGRDDPVTTWLVRAI
jgi:hypothetical protein